MIVINYNSLAFPMKSIECLVSISTLFINIEYNSGITPLQYYTLL